MRLENVLSSLSVADREPILRKLLDEIEGPVSACEKSTKIVKERAVYLDCEFYTNVIKYCYSVPRLAD